MFSRYVVEVAREGNGASQDDMDSTSYHVHTYRQADMSPSHVAGFKLCPIEQVFTREL
jgi:hypothetical protein